MLNLPLTNRPDQFALIDDVDLDLLRHSWYLKKSKSVWYVCTGVRQGRRVRTIRLHRLIASRVLGRDVSRSDDVHHLGHDTLDNRRSKFVVVDHAIHGMDRYLTDEFNQYLEDKYGPQN
jgi:hypothetical protein